jgi:hypothetical protein
MPGLQHLFLFSKTKIILRNLSQQKVLGLKSTTDIPETPTRCYTSGLQWNGWFVGKTDIASANRCLADLRPHQRYDTRGMSSTTHKYNKYVQILPS